MALLGTSPLLAATGEARGYGDGLQPCAHAVPSSSGVGCAAIFALIAAMQAE